jgi:stearoyl-CoA 9-desaturase NADPH oxidoreductase
MAQLTAQRPASQRSAARRRLSPLGMFPLGMFEALATPHGVDRYLELIHPMLTVRELRAVVTDVERSAADSITLTLRPTRQWRGFAAGQFVQISVDIDGVRRTRCYSPSCSQYRRDGRIEITVKAHPDGLVSQYLHANATPGLVLGLGPADGVFTLPARRPAKTLLISGGSGITPVLSMLRTLTDEGYDGEIVFLHYAFTETDVAHREALHALAEAHRNVRVVLAYTEQSALLSGSEQLRGHFTAAHLPHWHADAETFVCGPASLMRAVREHFDGIGRGAHVHTEEFTPPVVVPVDGDVTGQIAFGDTVVDNSGDTLLEQAEAAGLTPEFGCRMGICFTCTKVKTSGCTQNIRTGELSRDPDSEVQLCINRPVGDVAIDL